MKNTLYPQSYSSFGFPGLLGPRLILLIRATAPQIIPTNPSTPTMTAAASEPLQDREHARLATKNSNPNAATIVSAIF